jgi:hypothetical protein
MNRAPRDLIKGNASSALRCLELLDPSLRELDQLRRSQPLKDRQRFSPRGESSVQIAAVSQYVGDLPLRDRVRPHITQPFVHR